MWSGERLTKRQATSRPDHLWPELRRGMSKNAKLREKHKWAIEKPKLDNATRLRGIYFIDPEDMELKETIKNARKKLETLLAQAMPCKTCKKCKHGETRGKTNDFKSKFACILEASESTRMCMEEILPTYHEDHIAGKVDNSPQHTIWHTKFNPVPHAMKIPTLRNWKRWTHRKIHPRRINAKEVLTQQKEEYFYSSSSRWHSKIVRKRPRIPRTRSKAGTERKERGFQQRTSR